MTAPAPAVTSAVQPARMGERKEKGMLPCKDPSWKFPTSLPLSPHWLNSVTWPYLSVREAERYSLVLRGHVPSLSHPTEHELE